MPTRAPQLDRAPPRAGVARRAVVGGALLALMGAPAFAEMPASAPVLTLLSAAAAGDGAAGCPATAARKASSRASEPRLLPYWPESLFRASRTAS